jgi:lipopolysaccharide/colanic/teichoic acid biosynthesis glycosyltransferase
MDANSSKSANSIAPDRDCDLDSVSPVPLRSPLTWLGKSTALSISMIAFPLHLLLSAFIKTCDNGPALYRSPRLGKNGAPFQLLKYRSMKVNAPALMSSGLKMIVEREDSRVTTVGRWLRCGIDELPQLWNVVKGEMSWIGPRPDPDWMLPHYGPVCRKRLAVVPGITGYAQLLDSRFLSTAEGFAIDIWYLLHRTIWLDVWIVLATPAFIAGWRSLGRDRLARLRATPRFVELCRICEAELARRDGDVRDDVKPDVHQELIKI